MFTYGGVAKYEVLPVFHTLDPRGLIYMLPCQEISITYSNLYAHVLFLSIYISAACESYQTHATLHSTLPSSH